MSSFHRHPEGNLISKQTLLVGGNRTTIRLAGCIGTDGRDLAVIPGGSALTVDPAGKTGDSSLWTVTVKTDFRASKKEIRERIFANTAKWETRDWIDVVFWPEEETAPPMKISRLDVPFGTSLVDAAVWTPNELSLTRDLVFGWTSAVGRGSVQFFQLYDQVAPNWFGVLIPEGVTATNDVMVFFHPTPSQAGYEDADYGSKAGWAGIFHYLNDDMAAQFCAARTGQVLILPLMTNATAGTCGILPQHWESVFGQILGYIAAGPQSQSANPRPVNSVVVASFSSGIAYSAAFRARGNLGGRLAGVIDFDGIVSSYKEHSMALASLAPYPVVRLHQAAAQVTALPTLAARNYFPLGRERWGGPYAGLIPAEAKAAMGKIHGTIPQTMMLVAAKRGRVH